MHQKDCFQIQSTIFRWKLRRSQSGEMSFMEQVETYVQDVSSMMFSHEFRVFQLFRNFQHLVLFPNSGFPDFIDSRCLGAPAFKNLEESAQETLPTALWLGTFRVSWHLSGLRALLRISLEMEQLSFIKGTFCWGLIFNILHIIISSDY